MLDPRLLDTVPLTSANVFSDYRPSRHLLRSGSLYIETIEAVKPRTILSISYPKIIWILCENNSEARILNRFRSLNLSPRSKRFLFLIRSSMWNPEYQRKLYLKAGYSCAQKYRSCHPSRRRIVSGTYRYWIIKPIYIQYIMFSSRLQGSKRCYSIVDI
jgi:hypothetical protein